MAAMHTSPPGHGDATVAPPPPREPETLAAAALVLSIAADAAGERDLGAILRATLDHLRGVVSFTGGSIALVEDDDLVIRAAIGPFEAEALGQRMPRGPSASWRVIATGQPVGFPDLAAAGLRATSGDELRSWLAVPILRNATAIGLLEVDSTEAGAFDAEDERLLSIIARVLAGPIDLAAREARERHVRELREAFTAVVSHELRTPITTILGMSNLLRRRLAAIDRQELAHGLEDIESEADRLRRLTEDLLVLTRAEAGRLSIATEPLVLRHVAERAIAGERRRFPDRRFEADLPAGLPLVMGDALAVEQILRNLVGNAAKYSPEGSLVAVHATLEGECVLVRVLDEGPGLADGDPARLFDLFYRTPDAERATSGAGIGLYVCRRLVEAMGGTIRAASRPEGGAEFAFELPVAAADLVDDES